MSRFFLGARKIADGLFGLIMGVAVIAATIPAVYYHAGSALRSMGSTWPATIIAASLLGTFNLFRFLPFVVLYTPLKGIHLSLTRGIAYTARFLLSEVMSALEAGMVRPLHPVVDPSRVVLPPPISVKNIVQQQLDKHTQRLIAKNNFHQFQNKLTELEENQFQDYINSIPDNEKKAQEQAKLDEYISYMRQETPIQMIAYKDITEPVTLEWKENSKSYYSTYDKNDELFRLTMNSNPITRKPLDASDSKVYVGYKPAIMAFISYVREAIKMFFSPKNKVVAQEAVKGVPVSARASSGFLASHVSAEQKMPTLAIDDRKATFDSRNYEKYALRKR